MGQTERNRGMDTAAGGRTIQRDLLGGHRLQQIGGQNGFDQRQAKRHAAHSGGTVGTVRADDAIARHSRHWTVAGETAQRLGCAFRGRIGTNG